MVYSDTESVGEVSGERGKQESSLELQQTTAPCSVIQTVPLETTELNGQYSLVEAEPQRTTGPNTPLYSVVQKKPKQAKEPPLPAEPQQTTEPNTPLYSVVQKKPKQAKELPVPRDPQQSPDPNAQYAVVQKKPKQTKVLPVEPHNTTELNDQYSAVQEAVNMWGKDLDTRKQVVSVYIYLVKMLSIWEVFYNDNWKTNCVLLVS